MKKHRTKIALIVGIAFAATLLFAIPALAGPAHTEPVETGIVSHEPVIEEPVIEKPVIEAAEEIIEEKKPEGEILNQDEPEAKESDVLRGLQLIKERLTASHTGTHIYGLAEKENRREETQNRAIKRLFTYYGASDAEHVIIGMKGDLDFGEEAVDYINAHNLGRYGFVMVAFYRPFYADKFLEVIPDTVKKISVLIQEKEPGALGEPLYLDVVSALENSKFKDVPVSLEPRDLEKFLTKRDF